METTMSIKKNSYWKPYLWILLIAVLAYWPIAFQLFSIKNDNVMVFLAFRYNISEAIQHGHLPLWTPYINLGFPIHADIQSGAWNPIVWLFSLFGRYTLSTMHLETMLYIFIGGGAMFRLLKQFADDIQICLAFAVAYMLSGYFCDVAGNNILFLAGAAFTPLVLGCGVSLYRQQSFRNATTLAVWFYFLFSASYPFFTLVNGYILAGSVGWIIAKKIQLKKANEIFITIKYYGISALLFLLIAGPAMYSYLQFLPEYSRGNEISLQRANENQLSFASLISFLLPNANLKNDDIVSDLTMRNAFIGLIPFVLLIVWFFIKHKSKKEYFLFSAMLFCLFFALGSELPLHKILFHTVPLIDHFRHPANARIFFSISSLLLAALTLYKIRNHKLSSQIFKITAASLATGLLIFLSTRNDTFYNDAFSVFKNVSFSNRESLKETLNKLNTSFYIFFNAIVQFFFVCILFMISHRKLKRWLWALVFINSFVFLQISMPVTEVSKLSPSEGNHLLNSYVKGYPFPSLNKNITQQSETDSAHFIRIGQEMFYNKMIGFPSVNYNPTILHNIDSLTKSKTVFNKVMQHPFAYLDRDSSCLLSITTFCNNSISFNIQSQTANVLHIQQTLTKNWKAFVDNTKTDIRKSDIAFMSIALQPGIHKIELIYQPPYIILLCCIACLTLLMSCIFLLMKFLKNT